MGPSRRPSKDVSRGGGSSRVRASPSRYGIRRLAATVAVSSVATLALAAAPAAQASFTGVNGKIAWTGDNNDGWFATFQPGGSSASVLSAPVVYPNNIAWSRSGLKVAFDAPAISGGTGNALFIENADGTGL